MLRHFNVVCANALVELGQQALVAETDEEKFIINAKLDLVEAFIEAASKDIDEYLMQSYPASRASNDRQRSKDNPRRIPPSRDD